MLLYVVAVLGLPALHIGFHHDDHDHAGGGIHHHAAGLTDTDDDDDDHDGGHDHPVGEHGLGSLTHFATAFLPVLSSLAAAVCTTAQAQDLPLPPPEQVHGHEVETPLGPRGPPRPSV